MIIFDPFERAFWITAVLLLIFCSILFLNSGRKSKNIEEKRIIYGFSSFSFCFAISRLIFFISEFFVEGYYLGHIYYGEISQSSLIFDFLLLLGHITWMIGMTFFISLFETTVKFTKYILTILSIIFIIIIIVQFSLLYISIAFFLTILFFIIIWLSIKSSQELKGISAFIFIGVIFIGIGAFLTTWSIKRIINSIFPSLPPILYIIGTLILISPNYINPKYFSHALPFWLILITFLILFSIFSPIVIIGFSLNIYVTILLLILYIPAIIMLVYSINQIKNVLIEKEKIGKKDDKAHKDKIQKDKVQKETDFLKLFTRPQILTETEITFYKEQKICLVCKNRLSRSVYLCPRCDALYCKNCSIALSNLENACWVCNTAIDESKPIKQSQKSEEVMDIRDGNHKS